jgi:hypothetical protein
MNNLILNDVTLLLSVDILIETYMKYDKLLILRKKNNRYAYLKFVQNLKTIFLKLENQ